MKEDQTPAAAQKRKGIRYRRLGNWITGASLLKGIAKNTKENARLIREGDTLYTEPTQGMPKETRRALANRIRMEVFLYVIAGLFALASLIRFSRNLQNGHHVPFWTVLGAFVGVIAVAGIAINKLWQADNVQHGLTLSRRQWLGMGSPEETDSAVSTRVALQPASKPVLDDERE